MNRDSKRVLVRAQLLLEKQDRCPNTRQFRAETYWLTGETHFICLGCQLANEYPEMQVWTRSGRVVREQIVLGATK